MNIIRRSIIPVIAISLAIITSCVDGACYEDTESFLSVVFYRGDNKVSPQKLSVIGSGIEEYIYEDMTFVTNVKLPLNPAVGSVSFFFSINDTTDLVTFNYSSEPYMHSKECGYTWFYDILTASSTTNIIDSVTVTNAKATISDEENIRIYY